MSGTAMPRRRQHGAQPAARTSMPIRDSLLRRGLRRLGLTPRAGPKQADLASADAALATYQARLTAIVSSLRDGILLVDHDHKIEYANQQLCQQFGIEAAPESLIGMSAASFIGLIQHKYADPIGARARIAECVRVGEPVLGDEVNLADGRVLLRDFIPFRQHGDSIARIWHHRDVTALRNTQRELAEANRILADLSATDGLTGLANRRRFDQVLAQRHAAVDGTTRATGLILLDVDWFKPYNDHYGHLAGDECLKRIADALRTVAGDAEVVARYGGEEFAVVLDCGPLADWTYLTEAPKAPSRDTHRTMPAYTLAEQLRAAVQSLCIRHEHTPLGCVTLSVGVATLALSGATDAEHLKALSDRALYRAKHGGRNRVELAAPD